MNRIENTGVYGFEAAIRGMRNPMNSWNQSDSHVCACADGYLDCPMVLNDVNRQRNVTRINTIFVSEKKTFV